MLFKGTNLSPNRTDPSVILEGNQMEWCAKCLFIPVHQAKVE